ncbi:hypothetical protein [Nocardia sp. NPDC004604]|uniref:hypothetical protein n=1 Tax=Nocardia sp. NPDC004604 TaxID=3157013 RepID=UPI0033B0FF84
MSEGFRASPSGLNKPSADLAEVAVKIQTIVSRLDAVNTWNWGSWGTNGRGPNFATGENGYESSHDNLIGVLKAQIETLQNYSQGVTDTGVALTDTDHAGHDDFENI